MRLLYCLPGGDGIASSDTSLVPGADVEPEVVVQVAREIAMRSQSGRAWLAVSMVASIDGAVAVDGRSGGLGGGGDRAMFSAIRACTDVIVVGAGTFRVERYGMPRVSEGVAEWRRLNDLAPTPRLAIVTREVNLDFRQRASGIEPEDGAVAATVVPPMLIVPERADTSSVPGDVELLFAGRDRVDMAVAMTALLDRGYSHVVCEGGPTLNSALLRGDGVLFDEMWLTIASRIVGSAGPGIFADGGPMQVPRVPQNMRLAHVLEHEGELFLRYLRV